MPTQHRRSDVGSIAREFDPFMSPGAVMIQPLFCRFIFLITIAVGLFSYSLSSSAQIADSQRQSGKKTGKGKTPLTIELAAPTGGWTVDRMLEVSGKISDPSADPLTVNINGERYLLRNIEGRFNRKFPVTSGKNTVIVSATNQAGHVSESRTIYAKVPSLAMMAVLTSDTDDVYTDLHIYEPDSKVTPSDDVKPSVHVFWASTSSPSGGKFYLNEQGGDFDQPGYGPYLYTHASPALGIYRIDANYWPSGDKAHTVGTLNLSLFAGTISEQKRTVQQPLVTPGETITLAWVKIGKNQTGSIYVPGIDPKPKDNKIWPQWVIDAPIKSKSNGGGE